MKYISGALLLITVSLSTYAQYNKFELGVQGGPNVSFLRFQKTPGIKNSPLFAFTGGLFFQYNVTKTFSLRVDPGLERKGYCDQFPFGPPNDQNEKDRESFNYLTVPVLLRAAVGNKIRYFVNAGPYVAFLLSEKDRETPPNEATLVYTSTSYYQTTDWGVTTGLGLSIPVHEKVSISVEVRNNLGLTNINKNSGEYGTIKTNTTNVLFGLAYKFGSKK